MSVVTGKLRTGDIENRIDRVKAMLSCSIVIYSRETKDLKHPSGTITTADDPRCCFIYILGIKSQVDEQSLGRLCIFESSF